MERSLYLTKLNNFVLRVGGRWAKITDKGCSSVALKKKKKNKNKKIVKKQSIIDLIVLFMSSEKKKLRGIFSNRKSHLIITNFFFYYWHCCWCADVADTATNFVAAVVAVCYFWKKIFFTNVNKMRKMFFFLYTSIFFPFAFGICVHFISLTPI